VRLGLATALGTSLGGQPLRLDALGADSLAGTVRAAREAACCASSRAHP